jgi:hypothetical protein
MLLTLSPAALLFVSLLSHSIVGGRADMQEMLEFCSDKGVAPMVDIMKLSQVCWMSCWCQQLSLTGAAGADFLCSAYSCSLQQLLLSGCRTIDWGVSCREWQ